ncbi:F-box domain-containing protein [Aphelenchoides besseyi]|nr:F-box domain-containing protein [Aphelenchoides besseyi]KAI6207638.1 F-box domain-containing protein [Aphelenchoides besseyi]
MPFLGRDWRAPGEAWVKIDHTAGWERVKLRPIQIATCADSTLGIVVNDDHYKRHSSSASFSSSTDEIQFGSSPGVESMIMDHEDSVISESEDEEWIPHCFVKQNRSKEFIGCTSMSEAFHRLDLARGVQDVRRFNYICKVVQILVTEKLQNLSGLARKHLFGIIQAIVIQSVEQDVNVTTARDLVTRFGEKLEGHVYGSPKLVSHQQDMVSNLIDLVHVPQYTSIPDSSEESTTFLDLPRELITEILRRLPDHVSMLECAKANETLNALVTHEHRLWKSLATFHFTQEQINKHTKPDATWRHIFFELKKYYGLREVYADLIHICCHCKALFWKDLGHPCVSAGDAPSVRVMPQQFVDMLTDL